MKYQLLQKITLDLQLVVIQTLFVCNILFKINIIIMRHIKSNIMFNLLQGFVPMLCKLYFRLIFMILEG